MNRPDLNKLAKEVFEANRAKGFHEVERSNETLLMLVITELSEAVEADRKGKRADMQLYNTGIKKHNWLTETAIFEGTIKDSLEDELADAVIRLLDLAGLRGIDIDVNEVYASLSCDCSSEETFADSIYHISRTVVMRLDPNDERLEGIINLSIAEIEGLCEHLSIDLWRHVELKLQYNKTREYKHGKMY